MNLSSHSKEGTSLQFCILERGSKHFCMSIEGLGLDSMPKAKSCLVLTLRFTFTSEKILKGTLDGREREKENMNHSHDAFATWCTSTSHLLGSLVDLPFSLSAVETPSLAASPLHPHYTPVRSTPSLHHQCTALCGCSRSDAEPLPQGPGAHCCLYTPGLHFFTSLIPSIAHPSLPGHFVQAKTPCQGVDGQKIHEPQDFCPSSAQLQAGSQSGHASSSHCQPCVTLSDPVTAEAFVEQG